MSETSLPMTAKAYAATLPEDVFPDSRSRIPLIERESLDDEGRRDYDRHVGPDAVSLAGLQGPGGLKLHGSAKGRLGEGLGRRLQELLRLVVSREMDQAFEWTVHEPVALREGLDPAVIDVIRRHGDPAGLPEAEAALIQLGRELFRTHKVRSETFACATGALGEKNLVDACLLMGKYATTALLLHMADVHLPFDRKSLLPMP